MTTVASNQERDHYLLEKGENLAKWIGTLSAVKVNPLLHEQMTALAQNEKLPLLKKWILEQVRPNATKMDEVIQSIMNEYKFMPNEFTEEEKTKFKRYLECLNRAIK
jgi:hypothetical protein